MLTKIRNLFTTLKDHALLVIPVILFGLIGFSAMAHAADAAAPAGGSWWDAIKPAYDAVMSGHYIAAAALALVAAVTLLKMYTGNTSKVGAFIHGDVGGTIATFALSFFGAIATATLATGSGWAGLSLDVLKVSAGVGIVAIGGYTAIKKLVIPLLAPLVAKGPAWLQAAWKVVIFIFDRPSATDTAEQAGQAAVTANPAQGTTAVTGDKPTEIA